MSDGAVDHEDGIESVQVEKQVRGGGAGPGGLRKGPFQAAWVAPEPLSSSCRLSAFFARSLQAILRPKNQYLGGVPSVAWAQVQKDKSQFSFQGELWRRHWCFAEGRCNK